MLKSKRILALVVVIVVFSFSILAGCGKTATEVDTTTQEKTTEKEEVKETEKTPEPAENLIAEELTLKLYCVGDASPGEGSNMVRDAVNAIIKPKINATIATEYLPWADWTNKYLLVFASGEDFDGIYTADWSFYQAQATKNGFMEITQEMLDKYAPDLKNELPEMAWKQAKINGKIYMIPTTYNGSGTVHYAVREDLKAKYGVGEIKDLDSFGAFLEAIKKNEKDIIPLNISAQTEYTHLQQLFNVQNEYARVGGVPLYNLVYKISDPGVNIVNAFETPEFLEFVKKMNQWCKAGYWSKNALSNKSPMSTSFDNGTSASILTNILQATNYSYAWPKEHPDWQVQVYDSSMGNKQLGTAYIGSGIGINASSKKAGRLLMFANIARTDKELNQLLCYGIKDVHWKLIGEDQVEYIRGNAKVDYTDGLSWFFRSAEFQLKPAAVYSNYSKIYETAHKNDAGHILQAFSFNDAELKNEMASITSVVQQYGVPVITGFVDPEKGVETLNAKLKEASIDKVMAELKAQADKYLADNIK